MNIFAISPVINARALMRGRAVDTIDAYRPSVGAKYRWGIKISRFSTNKSLYLANDTR